MKKKTILHVDGNNFFASCEVLMNPTLKGKPVCVLSNNDGCVVSRSYEAKRLGMPMGIPYFMAKNKFKDVIYLSADFSLYHDISERMMKLLLNFSDKVDIYSIDEAFIDITNLDKILKLSFEEIGIKLKEAIETQIGINVAVGIANSKMLAKLATHKAKLGNGTYYIEEKNIEKELKNIPTEEIWGIGKNTSRLLKRYGIFFADEIIKKDENFYKEIMGKRGLELKYELSGISVIPLTGEAEKPKSIQRTRAFPEFSRDKDYIKTEIFMHLHNACKKLRYYQLKTKAIAVMLRTKDFKIQFAEEKLSSITDSELNLSEIVIKLFNNIYDEEITYRSAGIICYSFIDEEDKSQLTLFEDKKTEKGNKLSKVIDKIEHKFGNGSLLVGDNGIKTIQNKHKRELRHREIN